MCYYLNTIKCILVQVEDNIYSYVYRNYTYFFYANKSSFARPFSLLFDICYINLMSSKKRIRFVARKIVSQFFCAICFFALWEMQFPIM